MYRAWAAGDRTAGSALVERHLKPIWRFFANKAAASADLEDLVATTFERCATSLGTLREPERFSSYLYGIAVNVLRDHVRKRRPVAAGSLLDIAVADLDPSPSVVVAQRQQERLLLAALRAIPVEHQIVLELSMFEDMSRMQIAEVLALPPGTVANRLKRARSLVAERVEALAQDPALWRSTLAGLDDWARAIREAMRQIRG